MLPGEALHHRAGSPSTESEKTYATVYPLQDGISGRSCKFAVRVRSGTLYWYSIGTYRISTHGYLNTDGKLGL